MFFLLSKTLIFFTQPFVWFVLAMIWWVFTKKPQRRKLIGTTLVVAVLFFSNTFIFLEVCRLYEDQGVKIEKVGSYDLGIVLTGFGEYNNDLQRLRLHHNGDRMWQTLSLYHSGKIDKIMISGDTGFLTDRGLHEAEQTEDVLLKWGIQAEDIITENKSRNTYENAKFSAALLRDSFPELKKILLITSGTHMPRAIACFEKQGLQVDAFSTGHYTGKSRGYMASQYFIPSSETLSFWEYLLKEWVGYVVYDIVGYI